MPQPRRGAPPNKDNPLRAELDELFQKAENCNHYQLLSVEQHADGDAIQRAYFQLAKKWHPDRTPADMADLKPKISKVFARVNEAYQTLSGVKKRAEYDELVASGGGTAKDKALVEKALDSALLFQKAEVLFKKGALESAEELARKAHEADPDQPEYSTVLAWIEAQRLGAPDPPLEEGQRNHHYKTQIERLDKVIAKEPRYERALFYRAELLRLSGWGNKAIKDYRVVAKANPRNIDAARQVRLYEMRTGGGDKSKSKSKSNKDSGKGGKLFNRFFNKEGKK